MIRKLLIIIMGIFLVIAAGSCNIYPLYLRNMMTKFNYSLKSVNLYGSFINLGLWVAFPMGFIYDKYGPKISCIIGGILLSGSYAVLHLIMNSDLDSLHITFMLILGLIMGQGSALCYTTAVTTNLKNFRIKESSSIVGLLVANLAISPSIFTTYRQALTHMEIANYFLMISAFLAIIITICGIVYTNLKNLYSQKIEYEKYKEKKVIYLLIILNIVTLAIYTFGVIFNNLKSENRFPNIIVYPCLQLLNFLFLIFEKFSIFDNLYFKNFIEKKIENQLGSDITIRKSNKKENEQQIQIKNSIREESKVDKSIKSISLRNDLELIKNNQINFTDNKHNFTEFIDERKIGQIKSEMILNQINKVDEKENVKENEIQKENNIESKEINKNINIIENKENQQAQIKIDEAKYSLDISNLNNNESNRDNPESEYIKIIRIIKSKDIIILFSILVLGIGSVIANLNNIEFIVTSITVSPTSKDIFEYAILYFVFNSFSRIISGVILDKLIKFKLFFHFLVVTSIIGFISQILGIFMDKDILFLSIALAGLSHGGYMTFTPIFTRAKYGLNDMGKILGFLTTGCALGSILIADLIFTIFYDIYEDNKKCIGRRCFRGAYIISSIFFIANIVLSIILLRRNRN